jgi:hypothetical protein
MSEKPEDKSDIPYATPPNQTIRKKIGQGVQLHNIFTPEKIKECQEIVDKACANFSKEALDNLAIIELEYTKVAGNIANSKPYIDNICKMVFALKGQAEALGFTLGYEVAKSLHDYLLRPFRSDQESLLVVRKHLDILETVLRENILGEGGAMGRELLEHLAKLIRKMQ